MPVITTPHGHSYYCPAENIVLRSPNPVSALNMFASINLKNRPHRYGLLRRKKFDLNQATANMMMYTPFMKSDSVTVGDASRWESDMQEEIAKLHEDQSEGEKRISQTGSAIGAASAPAALWSAYRGAKNNEGGVPRSIARGTGKLLPEGKAKKKMLRAVKYLDKPMTPKARAATLAAGGGLIGLQVLNTAGDLVTTKATYKEKKAERDAS